jgi:hypothetical protein
MRPHDRTTAWNIYRTSQKAGRGNCVINILNREVWLVSDPSAWLSFHHQTKVVGLYDSNSRCSPFSYYYWFLIDMIQATDQHMLIRFDPLSINGKAGNEITPHSRNQTVALHF